jgi:hypothetical protein
LGGSSEQGGSPPESLTLGEIRGGLLSVVGSADILKTSLFVGDGAEAFRMEEKFWYLKGCSLFGSLSDQQVRRLEVRAKAREFRRGSLIYAPSDLGDCVLLLVSGRVKIFFNTQDGKLRPSS